MLLCQGSTNFIYGSVRLKVLICLTVFTWLVITWICIAFWLAAIKRFSKRSTLFEEGSIDLLLHGGAKTVSWSRGTGAVYVGLLILYIPFPPKSAKKHKSLCLWALSLIELEDVELVTGSTQKWTRSLHIWDACFSPIGTWSYGWGWKSFKKGTWDKPARFVGTALCESIISTSSSGDPIMCGFWWYIFCLDLFSYMILSMQLCHVLQHECRFAEAVKFMKDCSPSWSTCSSFMWVSAFIFF